MLSVHRSEEQCLDERRLAADLEQNPLFSQGCWHCARLFHRCRRLTGTEAPVESWVGEVKRLWDPVQGGAAATLANRLFLRVCGIRGDFSDDCFVDALVSQMLPSGAFPRREKEARALDAREEGNAQRTARLLWTVHGHTTGTLLEEPVLGRAGRDQILEDREKYAPTALEKATEDWLNKCQKNGRFCLPLTASTLRQWETDLAHDTRKGDRAQQRAHVVFGKKRGCAGRAARSQLQHVNSKAIISA